MRRAAVLDTRYKDMLEQGLNTRRLKGSRDAITLWSPRLRDACELGLKGRMRVPDMSIVDFRGKVNYFSIRFARYVKSAGVEPFTFHDLKSMGVSNFDGDKQEAGGWVDQSMVRIYGRSQLVVPATV
jgi:integrase